MTTAHLEAEILKLPRNVRAQLAERLISSLDEDSDIEKAWIDEAEKRYKAHQNGEGTISSAREVMTAIRKEFNL